MNVVGHSEWKEEKEGLQFLDGLKVGRTFRVEVLVRFSETRDMGQVLSEGNEFLVDTQLLEDR